MPNVVRKLEKASMGKGRSRIWRLSAPICNAEPTFYDWVPRVTRYERRRTEKEYLQLQTPMSQYKKGEDHHTHTFPNPSL